MFRHHGIDQVARMLEADTTEDLLRLDLLKVDLIDHGQFKLFL